MTSARVVGTHHNPHNDEYVMFLIALVAGWSINEFRFYRTGDAAVAAQEADPTIALFGIGGRANLSDGMVVIDEHQPGGRVAGECGATLLANELGVADLPELCDILAYAYRADTEGGQKYFELAEAVKTLHGYCDLDAGQIWEQIVRPCYMSVLAYARGDGVHELPEFDSFLGSNVPAKGAMIRKIVVPERPSVDVCGALWVLVALGSNHWRVRNPEIVFTDDIDLAYAASREKGTIVLGMGDGPWGEMDNFGLAEHEDSLVTRVAKEIPKIRKGPAKLILDEFKRWYADPAAVLPFELPTLVERLRTHGKMDSMGIVKLVSEVLASRYARSQAFQEAGQMKVDVLEQVAGLKVAFMDTDNAEAAGSLRGRKVADVIVLRKKSGNVNIFFQDAVKANVLPAVARELVIAESGTRGESGLVPDQLAALAAAGEQAWKGYALLPGEETWYVSYGAIHNGTTTHPDVPPTKLSREDIVGLIKLAIASTRV